jgi:hypothetical protein
MRGERGETTVPEVSTSVADTLLSFALPLLFCGQEGKRVRGQGGERVKGQEGKRVRG